MKGSALFRWLAGIILIALPLVGFQLIQSRELPRERGASIGAKGKTPLVLGVRLVVNSTGDGDNVGSPSSCNDGTGKCTLRAAIEVANAHAGDNSIRIAIPTSDPNFNGTFWT